MAWRIHDNVERGEIDNREKGIVRGRIWLKGLKKPVVLELQGNAAPDLAGCLLTFSNPGKTIPLSTDASFNPMQRGSMSQSCLTCGGTSELGFFLYLFQS